MSNPDNRKAGRAGGSDISKDAVDGVGSPSDPEISERKRMEDRLRETESRFQSIMEQSSEGIVLTDEVGNIIEWNRAQEEITGRPRAEVLGRPLWDVTREMMPAGRRATRR